MKAVPHRLDTLITVNVCGEKIQVYKNLLLRAPYFQNLLDGPFGDPKDPTEIFVDMNPKWFHICLDRMRYGNIPFNFSSSRKYAGLAFAAASLGLNFLTDEQEADNRKYEEEMKMTKEHGPTSIEIAQRLLPKDECYIFSRNPTGKYSWKNIAFHAYFPMHRKFRFKDDYSILTWKEVCQGQLKITDQEKLQDILARPIKNEKINVEYS